MSSASQASFKHSDFDLVALWLLYALPFGREGKRPQKHQKTHAENSDAAKTIDLIG